MRKTARRGLLSLAALAVLALAILLILLESAVVETTARGAPVRLRVPLGVGDIAFPITVAGGKRASIPGFLDGPVVRPLAGEAWSASWYCEDHAERVQGTGREVRIECAGRSHAFPLREAAVPPAVAPMPSRVAVLSDLEGNAAFLDAALRKLGITGPAGEWVYGDGQLVILGDSVDRGRDVFAVLWRLHALATQAADAGGAVRVLLGNHEQYMLRTNPSRASHDHLHALNAMGGYRGAFAADTVIGRWLRRQPVAIRLGDVLFAHGGVSPQVARSGLSIGQLNAAMREYWSAQPTTPAPTAAFDAVLGPNGLTQYRGYFREKEGAYPKARSEDVQRALDEFDARLVVVAHTIVGEITRMHRGRVIAVDVNDDAARPQVLVFEDGEPRIVDIGIGRGLGEGEGKAFRGFSLGDRADRSMLAAMVRDMRRLSALPFPY